MRRNITMLFNSFTAASMEKIQAICLRYVRKISGCKVPSNINQPAFERAVSKIVEASFELLNSMTAKAREKVVRNVR